MADKKLRQQCTAVDMYEQPQLWHYMYFKSEKKKNMSGRWVRQVRQWQMTTKTTEL